MNKPHTAFVYRELIFIELKIPLNELLVEMEALLIISKLIR